MTNEYPDKPGFKKVGTSSEAADAYAATAATIKEAVLDYLEGIAPEGRTPEEIAHQIGRSRYSVASRISELRADGLVTSMGERRLNGTTGHAADRVRATTTEERRARGGGSGLNTWAILHGPLVSVVRRLMPPGYTVLVSELADPGPMRAHGVVDILDAQDARVWSAVVGTIDFTPWLILQLANDMDEATLPALRAFLKTARQFGIEAAQLVFDDDTAKTVTVDGLIIAAEATIADAEAAA